MFGGRERRGWRGRAWALALLTTTAACAPTVASTPGVRIAPGAASFLYVDDRADPSKEMTVYTYLPRHLRASEAPIVFVLHGHHRTARAYRDDWAWPADRYGFMVVAPLFDADRWGGDYSYPREMSRSPDVSRWSYSVIEHLFDAIRAATGNTAQRYYLYGFSEGGQFVHRLVLLLPDARYARAVVGTPGWYTMPRFDVRFPYGLGGTPATPASLKAALERDVVLVLGGRDVDPNDPGLRRSPQALEQGASRVARGHAFFKEAEARAAQLKASLHWRLQMVPEAAHEPSKVSGAAAAALMGR